MILSDEFIEGLLRGWLAGMKSMNATPVMLVSRNEDGLHVFAAQNVTEKEIANATANVLVMMATGSRHPDGEAT